MTPKHLPFLIDALGCAIFAALISAVTPAWNLLALPDAWRWWITVGLVAFVAFLLWIGRTVEQRPRRALRAVGWNIAIAVIFIAFALRAETAVGTVLCLAVAVSDLAMAWWQRQTIRSLYRYTPA